MAKSTPPQYGGNDSSSYSQVTNVPETGSEVRVTSLSVPALAALVVGSMVGSGIFALPQNAAEVTAAGPAIIGWIITAIGMFALARVFQDLANHRPDLDAGVYAYARALFGRLIGFISAWGYWFSAWVGNIAYFVLLFGTMSIWFGGFEDGTTWVAIICASILLWLLHTLVLSGVKQAAFVNTIVTLAKLVPIVLFVIIAIIFFKMDTFTLDFWGTEGFGSIFEQTKGMMLLTVWVFIGIEGASVYSAHARKRSDVGKATVGGFITVLLLLMLVNLLSLGVMSRPEVAALEDPSMAGLMAEMIGKPGAIIISVGLVISILGALLAWVMIPVEILYVAGTDGTMPKVFGKLNRNGAPTAALWLTSVCMQVMLILTAFMGEKVYLALIYLASSLILVPYLLSALYALKLAAKGDGKAAAAGGGMLITGIIASIYGVWLLYAAGPEYMLFAALLYAPGLLIHIWASKDRGEKAFTRNEAIVAIALVVIAIIAIVLWWNGSISLGL